MKKIDVDQLVIIANSKCNMACSNCLLLPYMADRTNYDWDDERMTAWASMLNPHYISISGAELFLHPELELWHSNIRKLWPDAFIEIPTNGSLLIEKQETARNILKDGNSSIRVTCLNLGDQKYNELKENILKLLEPWADKVIERDCNDFEGSLEFVVNGSVYVRYDYLKEFLRPFYNTLDKNKVYFRNGGDAKNSFDACLWHSDYVINKGVMHHCAATAVFSSDTVSKYFSQDVKDSINKFSPIDPLDGYDIVKEYIENGKQKPIDMCKHCAFDIEESVSPRQLIQLVEFKED